MVWSRPIPDGNVPALLVFASFFADYAAAQEAPIPDAFRVADPAPGAFVKPSRALGGDEVKLLLRLEPGAHFGPVTALGTADGGQQLVSGSVDRSIRTWRTEDLSPLGVIRPPILSDFDGSVRQLQISGDGGLIAAAGSVGGPSEHVFDAQGHAVYDSAARNQRAIAIKGDIMLAVRPPAPSTRST